MTRNKLTFRDPLPALLAEATPADRQLDRRLREWLRECHTRLDRIVRFSGPADVELKVRHKALWGGGEAPCSQGIRGFLGARGTQGLGRGIRVRLGSV